MQKTIKIKNFMEYWYNSGIDETEIIKNNPEIFNKIDNELQQIYLKHSFILSGIDIIMMDFDYENITENLNCLFMDDIKHLTNELIECVKKYKNVEIKL